MTEQATARMHALVGGFRRVDRANYPEVNGLTEAQIYEGKMGPGGLYLAAQMVRSIPTAQRVFDLGCGHGASSVFLSRRLDAQVISGDLWISAIHRQSLVEQYGAQDLVIPIDLDIRRGLPFPSGYFDVVFCMDAFHYFGSRRDVVSRLAVALKPGGCLVVGNPCFSREVSKPVPSAWARAWPSEFSRYHFPDWWRRRLQKMELFEEVAAWEAADGQTLWEDELLYDFAHPTRQRDYLGDAEEIVTGRDRPGHAVLTHFILKAIKGRGVS